MKAKFSLFIILFNFSSFLSRSFFVFCFKMALYNDLNSTITEANCIINSILTDPPAKRVKNENSDFDNISNIGTPEFAIEYIIPKEEDFITLDDPLFECIKKEIELKDFNGTSKIYQNQEEEAKNILDLFSLKPKLRHILAIAQVQSGKTGIGVNIIYRLACKLHQNLSDINLNNIVVITGLSDLGWVEQTIQRFPYIFRERIYHHGDLHNFVNFMKNKKDSLIIIDEVQVACQINQKLHKIMKKLGFVDPQNLYENNIRFVEFTATPDGTLYDIMEWRDASTKIIIKPGHGYTSPYDLLQQGRVFQFKPLFCSNRNGKTPDSIIDNITEFVNKALSFKRPRYHIVRSPHGTFPIQKFKTNLSNIFDCDFIEFFQGSKLKNINDILCIKPEKHTVIFIKEKLRCAKTPILNHVGIWYERCIAGKINDTTIIQGVRIAGYNARNVDCVIFTNIETIVKYQKLFDSNFEDNTIAWSSTSTQQSYDEETDEVICISKGSWANPKQKKIKIIKKKLPLPIMVFSNNFDTNKQFFVEKIQPLFLKNNGKKLTGPSLRNRKKIEKGPKKGMYISTIHNKTGIYKWRNISCEIRTGFAEVHGFRTYPFYTNIKDKKTEKWVTLLDRKNKFLDKLLELSNLKIKDNKIYLDNLPIDFETK